MSEPHFELKSLCDELYWCLEDTYRADGDHVIKGPNEMVAFYCRPNEQEALEIAAALERAVAPVRERQAKELLTKINGLIAVIREQYP